MALWLEPTPTFQVQPEARPPRTMAAEERLRLLVPTPVAVHAVSDSTSSPQPSRKRQRRATAPLAAACGTAAVLASTLAWAGRTPGNPLLPPSAPALAVRPPATTPVLLNTSSVSLSNQHERRNGAPIGQGYLKWPYLAEMHEPTRFEVDGWADAGDGYSYTFATATGRDSSSSAWTTATEGPVAEFVYVSPGYHPAVLTTERLADGLVESYSFDVMVKYVRREIRNITEAQRAAFFGAMAVVYATPQADGERAYGLKFRSIERLVAEHLRGAAAKECDHWHDDAGIMTHHVAFTLEMEQALQSVDSTVAIPYWDYTSDAYVG